MSAKHSAALLSFLRLFALFWWHTPYGIDEFWFCWFCACKCRQLVRTHQDVGIDLNKYWKNFFYLNQLNKYRVILEHDSLENFIKAGVVSGVGICTAYVRVCECLAVKCVDEKRPMRLIAVYIIHYFFLSSSPFGMFIFNLCITNRQTYKISHRLNLWT